MTTEVGPAHPSAALRHVQLVEPMTWTSRRYGMTQTHPRWV
jgi:hypothetical protein